MTGAAIDRLRDVYARVYAACKLAGQPDYSARFSARDACKDFIELVIEEREREQ